MSYNCMNILRLTEAQLKYNYDVALKDATPQELHEALGHAVMMTISDNWNRSKNLRMHQRKAYYISAEYLIGRLVYSNLYNLGILDEMKQLFAERGVCSAAIVPRKTGWTSARATMLTLMIWNPAHVTTENFPDVTPSLKAGSVTIILVSVDLISTQCSKLWAKTAS